MGTIAAIARELGSVEHVDPVEVRQRAVQALAEASGGFVMYHSAGLDKAGVLRVGALACSAVAPSGRIEDLVGCPVPNGAAATQPGNPRDQDRFRTLADTMTLETLKKFDVWPALYEPNGFTENARLVVYRGNRFAGYIGAFYDSGAKTTLRVAKAIHPLVTPMRNALSVADALDADQFDGRTGWMVTNDTGAVTMSCQKASSWLTKSRMEQVRTMVRRVNRGEVAHAVIDGIELSGVRVQGDGKSSYVMSLTALEPLVLSAAAMLTPAQREVAELAAAGATAKEIGQATHRSVETVRTHLRTTYRRLGVSTRVELAQALTSTFKNFDER